MITRRHGIVAAAALPLAAQAQGWPDRPVRVVASFPPGGAGDAVARPVAEHLARAFGKPFVVENRGGAGGNIAAAEVARAEPDGHTLLITTGGPLTINRFLFTNPGFDPVADLAPVSLLAGPPNLLVVHPDLPARDVAGLIGHARAEPGRVAFGAAGVGTQSHLSAERFAQGGSLSVIVVPYRGAGPMMGDLLAGRVHASFGSLPSVLPQVREGRLRALAVTAEERWPTLPDVPTMRESGHPDFVDFGWVALVAPRATPAPIVARLSEASDAAVGDAAFRARLREIGFFPFGGPPERLARLIAEDTAKWGPVISALGIRAE